MTHLPLRRLRLALLAAVVTFVTAIGSLGAHVASGAQSGQRVIKVLSRTIKERVSEDKAPKGASTGDVVVGHSVLRNAVAQFGKAKGVVIGRDQYRIVLKTPNTSAIRVSVTLPGGTIACRGTLFRSRASQSLRVVQGTGIFTRATGTCDGIDAPKNPYGAGALNVYRLRIPG
jgi:hypothetical protein